MWRGFSEKIRILTHNYFKEIYLQTKLFSSRKEILSSTPPQFPSESREQKRFRGSRPAPLPSLRQEFETKTPPPEPRPSPREEKEATLKKAARRIRTSTSWREAEPSSPSRSTDLWLILTQSNMSEHSKRNGYKKRERKLFYREFIQLRNILLKICIFIGIKIVVVSTILFDPFSSCKCYTSRAFGLNRQLLFSCGILNKFSIYVLNNFGFDFWTLCNIKTINKVL